TLEPPQERCGPDVTRALYRTLVDIEETYQSWTSADRDRAGIVMYQKDAPPGGTAAETAGEAWDIMKLHKMGDPAVDLTKRTVMFEGRCYCASAANYAMWGVMNRVAFEYTLLPKYTLESAIAAVSYHKVADVFHGKFWNWTDEESQAIAFTILGYVGF